MENLRSAIRRFVSERDWEQFHSPEESRYGTKCGSFGDCGTFSMANTRTKP
jgi:hypothetical protein